MAHAGEPGPAPMRESSQVRQFLADANVQERILDRARDVAPLDTRGSCRDTIVVPGQGPSCRTAADQWRVDGDDHQSFVTHGPDSAVAAAGIVINLHPQMQAVLDAADRTDIACASNPQTPRYTAIYARPSGAEDRSAVVIPQLRREIYRASAFLGAQARIMAVRVERASCASIAMFRAKLKSK